jgi:hypothetical protein
MTLHVPPTAIPARGPGVAVEAARVERAGVADESKSKKYKL